MLKLAIQEKIAKARTEAKSVSLSRLTPNLLV